MGDNVIILGAGASADAGVPLMGTFVERMWEFALRGRSDDGLLTPEDVAIFRRVVEVRDELDGYHGRANFSDRNIEDILSILSFNALRGTPRDRRKLAAMTRAIARTIEITCRVKHSGELNRAQESGPSVYREFWKALFKWYGASNHWPAVITFNYDLVLERSLLQVLIGTTYNASDRPLPFDAIAVDYHYDGYPAPFYRLRNARYMTEARRDVPGISIEQCDAAPDGRRMLRVDLLKLHGSLNFPRRGSRGSSELTLYGPTADPLILPPIFNKLSGSTLDDLWSHGLAQLRSAKNVAIVGYSLPRTDIYMQYFLKAALGPNRDLNRISVFDPVLFGEDAAAAQQMKDRFASCFSPQLQGRIQFQPAANARGATPHGGEFSHFVATIRDHPEKVFF